MRPFPFLLALAGCSPDYSVTREAVCDGAKQASEATVDAPFDADGDGFFDANNPACAETYAAGALDCDEGDPEVNPGASEVACNDLDDDCDAGTPDAVDADGDGTDACGDCDDADPAVGPDASEVECNGVDDDCDAGTPDFTDRDGDGANSCEDCDDDVAAVHPGGVEIYCNLVDDDCNPESADDVDRDEDGTTTCDEDCDDLDPDRAPTFPEVCDDGIDNDCDEDVDEDCATDLTGLWALDQRVSYSCAWGLVNVGFSSVTIVDGYPAISVSASGSQPGTMSGSWTTTTTFRTENLLTGSCDETYTFDGTVVSGSQIAASFAIGFSGSCLDCRNQSYSLTATR